MYFFKKEGEMDKILEKIIAEDEDIAKAHRKFGEFTEDEKLRDLALRREMWQHDQATLRGVAVRRERAEGRAEGIEKGRLEEKQEILTRLLKIRFGSNKTAEEVIRSVTDVNLLDAALDEILSAVSVEDVLKVFQKS